MHEQHQERTIVLPVISVLVGFLRGTVSDLTSNICIRVVASRVEQYHFFVDCVCINALIIY